MSERDLYALLDVPRPAPIVWREVPHAHPSFRLFVAASEPYRHVAFWNCGPEDWLGE